jgi:hypothetical protein
MGELAVAKQLRNKKLQPAPVPAKSFAGTLAVDEKSPLAWLEHDFFERGLAPAEPNEFMMEAQKPRKAWWRIKR